MKPTIQLYPNSRLHWLLSAMLLLLPCITHAQIAEWAKTLQDRSNRSYGRTLNWSPSGQIILKGYVDSSTTIGGTLISGIKSNLDGGRFFAGYNTKGDVLWSFPFQCAGLYTPQGNYLFFTKKDYPWKVKDLTFNDSGTKVLRLDENHQVYKHHSLGRMLFPNNFDDQHIFLQTDAAGNIYQEQDINSREFIYNGIRVSDPPGKDISLLLKIGNDGRFRWIKEIVQSRRGDFPYFDYTIGENGCIYGIAHGFSSITVNNQSFLNSEKNLALALFKLDSNGNFLWVKQLKSQLYTPSKLLPHPDGGFIINDIYRGSFNYEGLTLPKANYNYQNFIMRILPDGSPAWATIISNLGAGETKQFSSSFQQHSNDEFFITGLFDGNIYAGKDTLWGHGGNNYSDAFIARINKDGKVLDLFSPGFGYNKNRLEIGSVLPEDSGTLYCTGSYIGEAHIGMNNLTVKNNNPTSLNFILFKLKLNFLHLPDSITARTDCHSDTVRFRLHQRARPDKVLWEFRDGSQSADLNPLHTYAGAGVYTVRHTAWFPDTVWRKQITVRIAKMPKTLFSSADTAFCRNASVDFSYLAKEASFQWSDGSGQSVRSFPQEGMYTLTISKYGCTVTDSVYIRLSDIKADLGPDRRICRGDSVVLFTPTGSAGRLWSTGSTDSAMTVRQTGTYWLQLTEGGCTVRDEIHIQVDSALTQPPLPRDTMICIGRPWIADLSGLKATGIRWQDGSDTQAYVISSPGQYRVTIENTCGQFSFSTTVGDSDCVCRIFLPNAFSPDKDALNPEFHPHSYCEWEEYHLCIYNRWGERIWESSRAGQGWDGTTQGAAAPVGVYLYTIHYCHPDGPPRMERGTVQLMRKE